jgi:SAM-dependent methyltransferase
MNKNQWCKMAKEYDNLVYSITKFPKKRERILKELRDNSRILIIGCGSAVYLQKAILKKFHNCKIVLSDLSQKMLDVSKMNFNSSNVFFIQEDMSKINYRNEFDFVITTNSILFPTIKENNNTIELLIKSLVEGGKLIGYFPSFESCQLLKHYNVPFNLDLIEQSLDDGCGFKQSFYTVNQLEKIGTNNNVKISSVKCDETVSELNSLMDIYNLSETQASIVFEHFVVLTK